MAVSNRRVRILTKDVHSIERVESFFFSGRKRGPERRKSSILTHLFPFVPTHGSLDVSYTSFGERRDPRLGHVIPDTSLSG